ncbi:MAG: POTRA domain-containing protein [Synergistes sp.]|nr:POTRA domain-containing protein [Synergistes sp.]
MMFIRSKYIVTAVAALLVTASCAFAADEKTASAPESASGDVRTVETASRDATGSEAGDAVPQDAPLKYAKDAIEARKQRVAEVRENLTGPVITKVDISGNVEVDTASIASVITTKSGDHLDEEKLRKDAEAVFELGFFTATDYKVEDDGDFVNVTFTVVENPKVEDIKFVGNTVYTEDQLKAVLFTQPGMIFNGTFFRNDVQRIREKYQNDGYVMASVQDVRIDGNTITVEVIEPKISEIIVQGNKITKRKIIDRYLLIKTGEIFNSNKLRLSINRLQGLGYFSDVNVNFEPGEQPDEVAVILTVEEGRTGKLGFNVSYGTESGFGGGLSYENTNIGGVGLKLSVGFEIGNRQQYWLSLEQPYMSGKVMSWKVGGYKHVWSDIYLYQRGKQYLEYDRDRYGAYVGFGKRFSDTSKYNWYLTLDWHNTNNSNIRERSGLNEDFPDPEAKEREKARLIEDELAQGNYYSATGSIRRFNLDEYSEVKKGDIETLNIMVGKADTDYNNYNYLKYWFEGKVYIPVGNFLEGLFDTGILDGFGGQPVSFAARVMAGWSNGDMPYDDMYKLGGDNTLRGYKDDYYRGRKAVLANFELRIPIQKIVSIVAFYDVGRAWDSGRTNVDGSELIYGSDDWGSAPGVGIRLNTPMGNLRLDYADGNEGRFHFGFGEMF